MLAKNGVNYTAGEMMNTGELGFSTVFNVSICLVIRMHMACVCIYLYIKTKNKKIYMKNMCHL